jgi:hypothetical protein
MEAALRRRLFYIGQVGYGTITGASNVISASFFTINSLLFHLKLA